MDSPMRFTSPDTVISPKGSVSNVRVLLNTGEGGFAIAAMQWENQESLGIRWNGHPENPLGNPQSRGIPTWFILPEEIASILRARFGASLADLNDQNADITRVRVRPLPRRILEGDEQDKIDDVWVLSITDRPQGTMEIMNPRTGHYLVLHRSHVKAFIRDPARETSNGPKHGLLDLTVQVVFEDGQVRLEPLHTLADRIDELFFELWETGYDNRRDDVRTLIEASRAALSDAAGQLGPWESRELDYADAATNTNFLRLALTAVRRALAVNKLTPDEYQFGFNYGRPAVPSGAK